MQRRRSFHGASLLMACTLLSVAAHSFYVPPEYEQVPLERLIRNLEAKVAAKPRDVQAVINLARTHAMAYASKSTLATVFKGDPERGWRQPSDTGHVPFDSPVATSDPNKRQAAQRHLQAALDLYRRATALAPDDLIIRLGHAWLTERSGDTRAAIGMYRDLLAREWAKDPTARSRQPRLRPVDSTIVFVEILPAFPYDSVIPEAVRYLIPLLDPARDRQEISELRESVAILNSRTRTVSPIAVPLRAGLHAADLEDRSARVAFDADGSGQRKHWTWITQDAAWLVYRRPAEIGSALQLFGNVTFWLFWDTGYEALGALDDDGDGTLQADEIAALALWHDGNGNGISEDGEVQPLAAHGIVTLSYRYQRDFQHPDHIAFAPAGMTLADGSTRPTYDLILHPR